MLKLKFTPVPTRTSTFDYLLPPPLSTISLHKPFSIPSKRRKKNAKKKSKLHVHFRQAPRQKSFTSIKLMHPRIQFHRHPPNSYSILPILHPTHTAIKKEHDTCLKRAKSHRRLRDSNSCSRRKCLSRASR